MSKRRLILVGGILVGCTLAAARAEGPAWKAVADAAPGALATQPAGVPPAAAQQADPFTARSGMTLSAASPFFNDASIPNRPSRFLLVSGMSQGYEIWNLKTGTKEKASNVSLGLREAVLSPDGQFIAGTHMGAGNAGIDIFSTRTDKVVSSVPPYQTPSFLGMNTHQRCKTRVCNLESGTG
jgi:hypothetical protein